MWENEWSAKLSKSLEEQKPESGRKEILGIQHQNKCGLLFQLKSKWSIKESSKSELLMPNLATAMTLILSVCEIFIITSWSQPKVFLGVLAFWSAANFNFEGYTPVWKETGREEGERWWDGYGFRLLPQLFNIFHISNSVRIPWG